MAKSIRVYTKKQRAAAPGTLIGVRLQPDQLASIDAWIKQHADNLSRPEAIRRLLDNALRRRKMAGRKRRLEVLRQLAEKGLKG